MSCITGWAAPTYATGGYGQEWSVSLNYLIPADELVSVPFSYETAYEGTEYSSGEYFFLPFNPVYDPETGCAQIYTGHETILFIPYDDNDSDIYTSYKYTSSVYTNSYQLPTLLRSENWTISYSEEYYVEPLYVYYTDLNIGVGTGIDQVFLRETVGAWRVKHNEIVAHMAQYSGAIQWSIYEETGISGVGMLFSDTVASYTNKFGDSEVQDRLILKHPDTMFYSLDELDDDPIELFRQAALNEIHTETSLNELVGIYPYRTNAYENSFAGTTIEVQ